MIELRSHYVAHALSNSKQSSWLGLLWSEPLCQGKTSILFVFVLLQLNKKPEQPAPNRRTIPHVPFPVGLSAPPILFSATGLSPRANVA